MNRFLLLMILCSVTRSAKFNANCQTITDCDSCGTTFSPQRYVSERSDRGLFYPKGCMYRSGTKINAIGVIRSVKI
jgi:hypothetical protein